MTWLPDYADLVPLIRLHLYPPDGQPADGWDLRRDLSILKMMLKRHPRDEIAHAIEGLALLRDFPEQCPDRVGAFQAGQKLTLRPLWAKAEGRTPMMTLALRAWWHRENRRTPKQAQAMQNLGDLMRRAMNGEPLPPPTRGRW